MNCTIACYSLGLLTVLTACAPTATPGGSSRSNNTSAVDYNTYNDDLASTRPSYAAPTSASVAATAIPARKSEAASTPARKPASQSDRPPIDRSQNEVMPVNKRLDALLDTIAQKNRSVRYAAGYRIQIYVGNERDAAKLQVYQSFPELSPYLSYKQPTYRLKVGDFMRRLDAEWYLSQLKQQFKSVILQPDKVDIRRSLLIK